MTRRPRLQDDSYQPFADGALASTSGLRVTFRGEPDEAKARAWRWQQQFCKWKANAIPIYHGLTTRRMKREDGEGWDVIVLTHQTARAGIEVTDVDTGAPINLDDFDEVLIARRNPLATLDLDEEFGTGATDAALDALPDNLFGKE